MLTASVENMLVTSINTTLERKLVLYTETELGSLLARDSGVTLWARDRQSVAVRRPHTLGA